MTHMNNWLGFSSLSPRDDDQDQTHRGHGFSSAVDVPGDCFDLAADESSAAVAVPAIPSPFALLDPFTRDNNSHSREWNINGGACNSQNGPKLENFFGLNQTAVYDSININEDNAINYGNCGGGGGSFGLSMVKTWLRDQPANYAENNVDGHGGARGLSLSMSSSSDNKNNNTDNDMKHDSCDSAVQEKTLSETTVGLEAVPRKAVDSFGQRTSIYRGVTRHRWTGRYEAHLWDNSSKREGQTRKGRQVYLGGYDKEEKAARAYDLAALKYWGTTTTTNFPIGDYEKEIEEMKHMTRQEYVASLRRKSSGFSRGASMYRGVTRHHQHGRWQARIGRVAGNKDLYLGTFSTQEEAAEAYDIAAIRFRGLNAVTNFDMNRYNVKAILESPTLPIGSASKRLRESTTEQMTIASTVSDEESSLNTASGVNNLWPSISFHLPNQGQLLSSSLPRYDVGIGQGRDWCHQEQDSELKPSHGFQHFFDSSPSLVMGSSDSVTICGREDGFGGYQGAGYGGRNSGFVVPMATSVLSNENVMINGSVYSVPDVTCDARNAYCLAQQAASSERDLPMGVPNVAAVGSNMYSGGASSTFTVWRDT
ncbi:PREDICTED: AP2-like ethylene-responsive transcription factor BBM2 [Tarenaya hassleriana]|uniref:AP2-like ethylene-responsive transcription factor BBM2 n=1 Tax=Tarenaya hassleriana TaxID=28532 RepID=UPI00053C73BC|nr:PREDICTED: AP2-like ethylene-responsive transcription factor BBM2 [Tarenaya hassleriana]